MFGSLHAFKSRNYRIYFIGQTMGMTGSFMQSVALSWLIYQVTNSAAWLGLITFFSQAPAFLLSPIAGTIVDRYDRRKLLLVIQWLLMSQAFLMTAMVVSGHLSITGIAILSIYAGILLPFDMTARATFVVDMVGKEEMGHAIALNSIILNASRILGPAAAGLILKVAGEKWCFFLNGLSYLATLYSLTQIKCHTELRTTGKLRIIEETSEAIRYLRNNQFILVSILITALTSIIFPVAIVLMPVFAKSILHGDSSTFAWLTATLGIGAIFGVLMLRDSAMDKNFHSRVMRHIAILGLCCLIFGLSRATWLSITMVFAIGYFQMTIFPKLNTGIQLVMDDRIRGRIMAIYNMTYLGAMPIGALLAGTSSDLIGPQATMTGTGALCILAFAIWIGITNKQVSLLQYFKI